MRKLHFLLAPVAALALFSCGNNENKEEATKTDTIVETQVVTDTVVTAAPIDSAAVVKYYEDAHAKAKGKHTNAYKAHKTVKNKQVSVDSHDPIDHHDVVSNPTPAPTAAPSPDATAPETKVIVIHDVETVYFRPDEKANFPGGEKAFDEYLSKSIEYPQDALDRGVQGTVYAIMTVDEQGNVTKVTFPEARLGYGLNRETERVLLASPRWNPAKHGGKPVKSKFTIPVTYAFK